MDNPKFVKLLEALGDLADNNECGFLQGSAGGTIALKISPRAVLHDEIDVVLGVNNLYVLEDT